MNVKLLFFPLAIVIALAVSIFYIKPEISLAMQNRDAVAAKQGVADGIAQKVRNVEALSTHLESNKINEDLALRYIPYTRDDDRIVDAVNFLMTQSGLALVSVDIEQVDTSADLAQAIAPTAESGATGTDGIALTPEQLLAVNIKPKKVVATVNAIGSYEGIRDVAGKFAHMDHVQGFTQMDISRAEFSGEENTGNSNILKTAVQIQFSYLPNMKIRGDVSLPILGQTQFDFATIDKLNAYISAPVPSLGVDGAGSANLFVR